MEKLGVFVLLWAIFIILFRIIIKLFVLSKYKIAIEKLNIDRFLLFIPEIAPIKELKNHMELRKLYIIFNIYKFVFWIGIFIIVIGIIIL